MSKDLVERMCEEAFGSHTDFNKDVMKKTLSVVLSEVEVAVRPLRDCKEDKLSGMYYKAHLEEGNVFVKAIEETLNDA